MTRFSYGDRWRDADDRTVRPRSNDAVDGVVVSGRRTVARN
jgi:hypothetical protein